MRASSSFAVFKQVKMSSRLWINNKIIAIAPANRLIPRPDLPATLLQEYKMGLACKGTRGTRYLIGARLLDRETSRNNPSKEMHEMFSQGYGKAYPAIRWVLESCLSCLAGRALWGASHTTKPAGNSHPQDTEYSSVIKG